MCWNESVSLNTFLFSSFVLVLIIYNNSYTKYKIQGLNNTWMYILIASFVFMQLIEFFIWRNIKNQFYNNIFSILGLLLLFVQPIASIMLLQNIELRNSLLASYLLVATPYSIYEFSTRHIHTVVSKLGHLKWSIFQDLSIVWVGWLFFFLFSFVYNKNWSGLLFVFITLVISVLNYKNDQSIGSTWCWIVNSVMIYYAIYLLLYLPFLEKQNIY